MKCSHCGANNPDGSARCATCFIAFKAPLAPESTPVGSQSPYPAPPQVGYGYSPPRYTRVNTARSSSSGSIVVIVIIVCLAVLGGASVVGYSVYRSISRSTASDPRFAVNDAGVSTFTPDPSSRQFTRRVPAGPQGIQFRGMPPPPANRPPIGGPQFPMNNQPSIAQQQMQEQMGRAQQLHDQNMQQMDQMQADSQARLQQMREQSQQNMDETHDSMQNDMQRIRTQMRAGPGYSGLGQGVPGL